MSEAATTTTEATTTTTTEPGGGGAPPATSTTGYDWKAGGVDDAGLNLINDRQWKTPGDLLKSYSNLEKLTGVPADQLIKLPKTGDEKAWGEVYTKLGRPASADKYVIPVPEGQPTDFAKKAGEWFFEAGLPQSAVTKITEKWNNMVAEQTKAAEEKNTQEHTLQMANLKKEWGADYDKNVEVVDMAAETFGMSEEQLAALKGVLGPEQAFKFMHNIGKRIGVESGKDPAGMGGKGEFTMTQDMAKAKIAELRGSRDFAALFTSADPKTKMEAQAEMNRLHQIAYPGETTFAAQATRA